MKIHPQIIHKDKSPAFVVLPVNEYEELISCIEEHEDIEEVMKYLDNPTETFPLEVVDRLANNEHPIAVFREYRNISQTDLAKKVGISKQYISQLEHGERTGSARVLKDIAQVLQIDIGELL